MAAPRAGSPPRPLLVALALVSAAALAYEILLMRLLSIVQWHHFAYMVISLALLGYGASGTFLSLARRWLLPRFGPAFAASAALLGSAGGLCFAAARTVPFNAPEVLWDPHQWGYLVLLYLILIPPFFFAANCTGLAFQHYRGALGRVYAADLWGAGGGALGIILLLFALSPLPALAVTGGLAFAAAALAWWGLDLRPRGLAPLLLALAPLSGLILLGSGLDLRPVEYKGLAQALRVVGAEPVAERSSPLGLLSVVRSPRVPFRHVPGLSLASPAPAPEQLAVFTDGDGLNVINRWDGRRESLAFLDYLPSALPYHLLPAGPRVLILGAGGGSEVLQALFHRAESIDAVELNLQLVELVSRDFAHFAGPVYRRPEVRVHVAEARGFVAASARNFDLIQLALVDAFTTSSAGLYGLNESYLYTVEALQTYLAHLRPGGFLALTRWVRLPPRDELKLFATAVEALRRGGEEPAPRLGWIRGWQTSTLVIKNGELSEADRTALRRFAEDRAFDPAWYPGMTEAEANVHNLLAEPYLYRAATHLLGPAARDFIDRYKFDIAPATDDRPYFFHFFRWGTLAEALALKGAGGLSLLDPGYPVLLATLVQAAGLSLLFILAPLRVFGGGTAPPRQKAGIAAYFALVGLAFMLTEMIYVQKFILYLAHPLYAVAVVVAGFLLFAGIGSRHAARLSTAQSRGGIVRAAAAIAAISLIYLILLPPLFEVSLALPIPVKIAVVLVLIAPLAFFMGMPFPLGLGQLGETAAELIPWAFGINGCASVVAAILATLLAIHCGQTAVLLIALVLYGLSARVGAGGFVGRSSRDGAPRPAASRTGRSGKPLERRGHEAPS